MVFLNVNLNRGAINIYEYISSGNNYADSHYETMGKKKLNIGAKRKKNIQILVQVIDETH